MNRTSAIFGSTLFLIILINYTDRYALSILLPDISRDLGFSDLQIGLLGGLPFAVLYSLVGIPFARIADTADRGRLIAIAVMVWSFATVGCGAVVGFWSLFMMRVAVGIGEGAGTPAIHSIISERFGAVKGSGPASMFGLGSALGAFIGMAAGGALAAQYGWRVAFVVIGVPGLAIALAARLLVIDRRAPHPMPALRDMIGGAAIGTIRELFAIRGYAFCVMGMTMVYFVQHGLNQWLAVFLVRYYGLSTAEIGPVLGALTGAGSGLGSLTGGYFGMRLARRNIGWLLTMPGLCCALTAPLVIILPLLRDVTWIYAALGVIAFLNGMLAGPTFAAVYALAGGHRTATAVAMMALVTTIVGMTFGPLAVGMLSEGLEPRIGVDALRYALVAADVVMIPAAVLFLLGGQALWGEHDRLTTPATT
jgi:MFS family permease